MNPRILYTKPSITELEIRYATDAAANGWGDQCYAYIERFEQAFCRHLGVRHALATSSCTGAMHMGLAALGIGPGDEVILADTNWIATAAPISRRTLWEWARDACLLRREARHRTIHQSEAA